MQYVLGILGIYLAIGVLIVCTSLISIATFTDMEEHEMAREAVQTSPFSFFLGMFLIVFTWPKIVRGVFILYQDELRLRRLERRTCRVRRARWCLRSEFCLPADLWICIAGLSLLPVPARCSGTCVASDSSSDRCPMGSHLKAETRLRNALIGKFFPGSKCPSPS